MAHRVFSIFSKMTLGNPVFHNLISRLYRYNGLSTGKTICCIKFPNPVGLAAGFDKNATFFNELSAFGFGFIEIGTVTPRPQPGNPRPRIFRLVRDKALINRMGFNNDGVIAVAKRLEKRREGIIIGSNIGKNRDTPNESAVLDYLACFETLFEYSDYFAVNVSSPNTPGLRDLQEKENLLKVLGGLTNANKKRNKEKPVFLKISPDLNPGQVDDIMEAVEQTGIQGLIVGNTTILRDGLMTPKPVTDNIGAGGLSGKPLQKKSDEMIKEIRSRNRKIPIIGSGGVFTPEDALQKMEAGADLIQVYTGFIYEGPGIVKAINRELSVRESKFGV